jgi:hypothetical protein
MFDSWIGASLVMIPPPGLGLLLVTTDQLTPRTSRFSFG